MAAEPDFCLALLLLCQQNIIDWWNNHDFFLSFFTKRTKKHKIKLEGSMMPYPDDATDPTLIINQFQKVHDQNCCLHLKRTDKQKIP